MPSTESNAMDMIYWTSLSQNVEKWPCTLEQTYVAVWLGLGPWLTDMLYVSAECMRLVDLKMYAVPLQYSHICTDMSLTFDFSPLKLFPQFVWVAVAEKVFGVRVQRGRS